MNISVRLATLALLFVFSPASQAVLITSSIGKFEVTTATALTVAELDSEPWWGSEFLASEFAVLINDTLGLPNFGGESPYFAFSGTQAATCSFGTPPCDLQILLFPGTFDSFVNQNFEFAIAREVTDVPEPTTLALMSLGLAGIGYSRKRNRS